MKPAVVDVTKQPYRQVAKYRKNDISPMLYPNIIYTTAQKYNEAFVLVEVNDIGQQVAEILHQEVEYENMLSTVTEQARQYVSPGFGKATKISVEKYLKKYIKYY